MEHVIVTRFSVPRPQDPASEGLHRETTWLDVRLDLFRRFFLPSTQSLGVPVILLCSSNSADYVADRTELPPGFEIVVQDTWHGGWRGSRGQMVTRLDSDDAVREDWLAALDRALENAPPGVEVYGTKRFLRLDATSGRVYGYSRRHPCPLAAFADGANPFAFDHDDIEQHYRTHILPGSYLLQAYHGGNLSSRSPRHKIHRRVSKRRLSAFGLGPAST